jgi:membrane protease YdiL (CAAX protease family)
VLGIKGPFLVAALVFWAAWIAVRVRRDPGVLRDWGFRLDNWRPAALASGAILVAGAAGMVAFAAARGTLRLPAGFWILLPLYPFWGTLQQLVLGGLLARNLRARLSPAATVLVASILFALVHLPGLELAALTFVAGLCWVSVFLRWPNAWLLGFSHGVLASLAYYLVLEHDVWAALGLGG